MSSLRFGKNQLAFLKRLLEEYSGPTYTEATAKDKRMAQELLDKLEKSELVKKKSPEGLGWYAASEAMREVAAGIPVALPPNPTMEWKGWMSATIRKYGLTREDCQKLARGAIAKGWRPLNFELLIKNAVRYLAEETPSEGRMGSPRSGPLELEDL